MLPMLPIFAINSQSLVYNRQVTPGGASFYDIHEQIPWTADQAQTLKTVVLKRVIRQDVLDKFMMDTYKDPNDYRTIVLSQLRLGCMRTIEDKIIYGDVDNDAAEFDGVGHLFEADAADGDDWGVSSGDPQLYDEGDATLQIVHLRELIDRVKPKPDILLMGRTIRNRLSAAAFEVGISTNVPGGLITMSKNEFGARVEFFDGIRIVISDFVLNEVDNTGDKDPGDDSLISSIYAIRFGQIMDGGLSMAVGGNTGGPEFFNLVQIENLEDYDAAGMRLVAYCALAVGSSKAIGRIHSIDTAVAVSA